MTLVQFMAKALGWFWKFNLHSMRNAWSLHGSVPSNKSGSQTLVFPDEESQSAEAEATLVGACIACVNRSKGSRVGI